jgi:hypothetical protein
MRVAIHLGRLVLGMSGVLFGAGGAGPSIDAADVAPPAARALDMLKRQPLAFEAVAASRAGDIRFVAQGGGLSVALSRDGALISSADTPGGLLLKLSNANPIATIEGERELPGRVNYFLGSDPAKWQRDVRTFERVRAAEVYPGIDVVFYGNGSRLEYDFVVKPDADPKAIALVFQGGNPLIDAQGDLVFDGKTAGFVQKRPIVYQESSSGRELVAARYVPRGKGRVGLEINGYDPTRALVIDPVLVYSTTLSGTEKNLTNIAYGVASDTAGNAYVTGTTGSKTFPTMNPFQASNAGGRNVFITKLSPQGTILYSTYLGGTGADDGRAIALDGNGNIYVTGVATSTNFPTKNPIQAAHGGGTFDAFVAKLNAAGNALVYSTYLGGGNFDVAMGIAVDPTGIAYVMGSTFSNNFPTKNALQPTYGGAGDAFVTKIAPDGASLVYSTYLGGSAAESNDGTNGQFGGIAADTAGNAYVTGYTESTNFPTSNPFQATKSAGVRTAFVTKIKPDGSGFGYSSFLGGAAYGSGFAIAVDSSGSAFVAGSSTDGGVGTAGAFQQHTVSTNDAFVAKVKPDGTGYAWFTYVGGHGDDGAAGIALDASGNVSIAGYSASTDFPSLNPIQAQGGGNVFKSTNAGGAWSVSSSGLQCGATYALAQDPTTATTFYAGTDNGVFKSTDGGGTWKATGLIIFPTYALSIDPSSAATVYAGTLTDIRKSADGGTTWTTVYTLPSGAFTVKALVVDPSNSQNVYATFGTSFSGGTVKSTNGGGTWATLAGGLPAKGILSLVLDARAPATLYAGGGDSQTGLLYKSTDGGNTWTSMTTGLAPLEVNSIVIDPGSSSTLYAAVGAGGTSNGSRIPGVYKSTNGGASWTLAVQTAWDAVTLGISPTSPATVYLSGYPNFFGKDVGATPTGQGLYSSADGGATWALLGLNGHLVNAVVVDKTNPSNLVVAAQGGRTQFLATLKPDGSALTGSSFYGGTGTDEALAVAAGPGNNAFFAGMARSQDYPKQSPLGLRGALTVSIPRGTGSLSTAVGLTTGKPPETDVGIGLSFDPPTFLTLHHSRTVTVTITNNGPSAVDNVYYELDAVLPGPTAALAKQYGYPWSASYYVYDPPDCPGPGPVPGSANLFEQHCESQTGPIPPRNSVTKSRPIIFAWPHSFASPRPFAFQAKLITVYGAEDTNPANNFVTPQTVPVSNPVPATNFPRPCGILPQHPATFGATASPVQVGCSIFDVAVDITTVTASNPDFSFSLDAYAFYLYFPACYFANPGDYMFTVTNSPPGGSLPFSLNVGPYAAPDTLKLQNASGLYYLYLLLFGNFAASPTGCAPQARLAATQPSVTFGGVAAPVLALTSNFLLTRVPAGAQTGPVTVTTAAGTATSTQTFTVLPTSAPAVVSTSPGTGPAAGGTLVTITGSGFQAGAAVTFGGVPAKGVNVTSATSLAAIAPPGSGTVDVRVTNQDTGTATKAGAFTYSAGAGTTVRFISVALDVVSSAGQTTAHFLTELTLTNSGTSDATISMTYAPSIGGGGGVAADTLLKGTQKVIPDAIAYLRSKGLAIPTSGSQLGTISIQFSGVSSVDAVSATARTASATSAPQPIGFAGLAYSGLYSFDGVTTSATLYGMRQNDSDRSNVAVFNTGSDPVTLKVTAFSGDDGSSAVVDAAKTLPAGGWAQYSGILGSVGIAQGWVTIERTSASGSFSAYGVINDNGTNDGSYVLPTAFTPNPFLMPVITLPVIVETGAFQSEMVVANRSADVVTFLLTYTESSVEGTIPLSLQPGEQRIIPGAVNFFRQLGVPIGDFGAGSYVGTVRTLVLGTSLDNVFIGARTATPSPAGGQFGLFTPGVYAGQEASGSAYVYGLRSDANNRSNVAILNAGQDSDGPVTLSVQAYNSDAGGAPAGSAETTTLNPGQWQQYNNLLASKGVSNGWVKVTRTAGTAAWIAYGVINDGGQPGQRTGDGAYIPMVK